MLKALRALLVLSALAAGFAFLPFGGRTLLDRARAAASPSDFAARLWSEMRAVAAPERNARPGASKKAQARAPERRSGERPVEGHTDADRKALDRLLTDHLEDAPPGDR